MAWHIPQKMCATVKALSTEVKVSLSLDYVVLCEMSLNTASVQCRHPLFSSATDSICPLYGLDFLYTPL